MVCVSACGFKRIKNTVGEREDPIAGTIIDYKVMGSYVDMVVAVNKLQNVHLTLSIPLHVAQRTTSCYPLL